MKIFKRHIINRLKQFAKFKVVVVLGPRQSGKTTLVREFFKGHTYVNLEDPKVREFALMDPKAFLKQYQHNNTTGIIIDEFQHVPDLLSYIQLIVDEKRRPGYFVLTGSQNFLMNQAITQSLAGRAGILTLLPLSVQELVDSKLISDDVSDVIIKGGYPGPYAEGISPQEFFPSYIQTYVERDIRQLVNVKNLDVFNNFLRLCAGRIGQIINIADLAMQCGIDQRTANGWLSLLRSSYIIFLLQPYSKNYNKRIIKKPKMFFFDTGLVSSLLGIRTKENFFLSPFRGHLFENFVIADFYKQYYNLAINPSLYFWRDKNGRIEIDCIIDRADKQIPIEIKSGETINQSFFEGLTEWSKLAQMDPKDGYIVYAGSLKQSRSKGNIIGWHEARNLIEKIGV